MEIVEKKISLETLKKMSQKMFGDFVKAVVDIEKEIMIVDAGLHADEEQELLEHGSSQEFLWGINLHPEKFPAPEWIEFDSMINIRPAIDNKSRYVHNPEIRKKIIAIVNKLITQ